MENGNSTPTTAPQLRGYINPFTDFGFKWLFKNEQHKIILITFLNDLLHGEKVIKEVTYLESDIQAEDPNGRNCLFDIICKDQNDERYIIEMQNKSEQFMLNRLIYYTSRLHASGGVKGVWDYQVSGIITICIANFLIYKDDRVREEYEIVNRLHMDREIKNYKIITLHLPKVPKNEEDCATEIEKWLHLLIQMTRMENIALREQRAIFKKLLEVGNVAALNEHDRAQYECNLKHCAVFMSQLEYAEKQGEEKGREEAAIAMKRDGIDFSIIAKYTKLSVSQIEKL
jgi:predicted transposase/invertase (TIGR01784 family)